MHSDKIIGAVTSVTKTWTKQRKAEERKASASMRRREVMTYRRTVTIQDVAYDVMEKAYLKASANGTLPALARQIMYAARGEIQARTGRMLNDTYFTQTLLPDYMAEFGMANRWNVVFDARGHLHEPHTKLIVPLGTIDVRKYLATEGALKYSLDLRLPDGSNYPTCGPKRRYGAILFIEKEGFLPLLQETKLAERYDIAIMSTKGMSNTASRELVDRLCFKHDIPLLVLHDFDKSGFSIVGTLRRSNRRYTFQNDIQVTDLGLRLEDVEAHDLETESVRRLGWDAKENLRENGATEEEIEFLTDRRVELNAFASDELIRWIEGKLDEQGIEKVVPNDKTVESAYRRVVEADYIKKHTKEIFESAVKHAAVSEIPDDLRGQIAKRLKDTPELRWDHAVWNVVHEADE